MVRSSEVAQRAVPDVVAPPPLHPRFPLSDGVRGIASTMIIAVHVWIFTGGFGGFASTLPNRLMVRLDALIPTFFLLSAFLLYRPMIAHRAGGPPSPQVADYAKRRFLRIYPAYWLALTALAILPGLAGVFTSHWAAFYSLADYLHPAWTASVCSPTQDFVCGLSQSWTLTTEMTFYIVLPLYAALTAWIARRCTVRTWVRTELALLAALSVISVILGSAPLSLRNQPWFWFTFGGHFLWFAVGLAFAVISVNVHGRASQPPLVRAAANRPGLCWLGALLIYLVTVLTLPVVPFGAGPITTPQFIETYALQAVIAALLMVPVVFSNPNRGVPAKILGNPIACWLGLVSLGLYLWHLTIAYDLGVGGAKADFGTVLALTLLLTIPLAALSYYVVERPLMRFKYVSVRGALRRGVSMASLRRAGNRSQSPVQRELTDPRPAPDAAQTQSAPRPSTNLLLVAEQREEDAPGGGSRV
jgi:peptidoglycan/LPS O-acetylase OafA/YrhL